MLNKDLWKTFERVWQIQDIEDIARRLTFLKDIIEDALRQYDAEDVLSELDLNLHIYMAYFQIAGNERVSAWQIHDAWLNYHSSGEGLSADISKILRDAFLSESEDIKAELATILGCIDAGSLVLSETDAVVWLSLLDHLASRIICRIGARRLAAAIGGA